MAGKQSGLNTQVVIGGVVAAFAIMVVLLVVAPKNRAFDFMRHGVPSLVEAKACLRERDFACAEADFRAYLKQYPDDSSANAIMGITLSQDGRHKQAIPYFQRAIALGVSTYDLYANYAISLNNTGQVDEAIKMNYAALKIVPSLVDVRGALADQLVRRNRAQEALSLLESFDQSLEERGYPAYFEAKAAQLRAKIGGAPSLEAAASQTGAANLPGAPAAEGTSNIALKPENGTLYVPVLIDDAVTLKFVVDSGASDVTIPADVAQTLQRMGKIRPGDFRGARQYVMANGSKAWAQVVIIHSMKIGDREVRDVTGSITNREGALLLGQSFLKRFKSWSIDNNRRVLVLKG
jgi:clan AA aspartic protease (TIGR02281 family)